ncbi:Uracil-DNA glycosylase, family 3 [Olavius algarvensis Delta 1 endosymbiont]|nr:Uracil-DNA glycosylase, family 3 [Olavius algarvensis Delta 1 endosymbiont]
MTKSHLALESITDELSAELRPLKFSAPVTHVYNPLEYARAPYSEYLRRYATAPKEIVLIGMNPGPWGMAQTGIPFGEVAAVRDWLDIKGAVGEPAAPHPKRPVDGFDCPRSEVSGKRIWGWARKRFATPAVFFSRFFIANYCPLQFIEAGGRNRTPNQLRSAERKDLFSACDRALRRTIEQLKPHWVIGVGRFTTERARIALADIAVEIGGITHPSPANPKANRGWEAIVEKEFAEMGIALPE